MRVRIKERVWLASLLYKCIFFFIKWVSSSDNILVLPLLLAVYVTKKKIFMVVMCYADDKWVIKDLFFLTLFILIIIVLKPGPALRVDPRLEPDRVDEKIRKVMSRVTQPTRLTRQNPVKNSVATR
jgi:hypothetical protein